MLRTGGIGPLNAPSTESDEMFGPSAHFTEAGSAIASVLAENATAGSDCPAVEVNSAMPLSRPAVRCQLPSAGSTRRILRVQRQRERIALPSPTDTPSPRR